MASGALNQARIAKSGVLVKNLTGLVTKWEVAGQLDSAVEMMSAAQQVNALQHAGVQWFHEEYIPREANIKMAEPVRSVESAAAAKINIFHFSDPPKYNGKTLPARL